MFGRPDVYATVGGFNVRVKDEREQDKNHLVEATFEVPLTFELMDEINPAIAKDLFNTSRGEHTPKPELNDAGLNLAPEPQLLKLKNHPELEPEVTIPSVGIRKVRAKKGEGNTWLLVFTATWTLGDPKEVMIIIQRLKQGTYLTMMAMEPRLDLQEPGPDEPAATATVEPGGNVTSIQTGGRRGRKKKDPEGEAKNQEEAGRAALPDPDEAGGDASGGGDPRDVPTAH